MQLIALSLLPLAYASTMGHGLDNNWNVSITGERDGNGCFTFTGASQIEDLGLQNVPHSYTNSQETYYCPLSFKRCRCSLCFEFFPKDPSLV